MDAITLLKSDHRTVEKLFKDFERAGDRAAVSKGKITQSIIKELSVHAAIEEQAFYPVIQGRCKEPLAASSRASRSTTSPNGCYRSWKGWTLAMSGSTPK